MIPSPSQDPANPPISKKKSNVFAPIKGLFDSHWKRSSSTDANLAVSTTPPPTTPTTIPTTIQSTPPNSNAIPAKQTDNAILPYLKNKLKKIQTTGVFSPQSKIRKFLGGRQGHKRSHSSGDDAINHDEEEEEEEDEEMPDVDSIPVALRPKKAEESNEAKSTDETTDALFDTRKPRKPKKRRKRAKKPTSSPIIPPQNIEFEEGKSESSRDDVMDRRIFDEPEQFKSICKLYESEIAKLTAERDGIRSQLQKIMFYFRPFALLNTYILGIPTRYFLVIFILQLFVFAEISKEVGTISAVMCILILIMIFFGVIELAFGSVLHYSFMAPKKHGKLRTKTVMNDADALLQLLHGVSQRIQRIYDLVSWSDQNLSFIVLVIMVVVTYTTWSLSSLQIGLILVSIVLLYAFVRYYTHKSLRKEAIQEASSHM